MPARILEVMKVTGCSERPLDRNWGHNAGRTGAGCCDAPRCETPWLSWCVPPDIRDLTVVVPRAWDHPHRCEDRLQPSPRERETETAATRQSSLTKDGGLAAGQDHEDDDKGHG